MRVVSIRSDYARALEIVPQALDKSDKRPYLIMSVGAPDMALFVPFHTVSNQNRSARPREWAIFYSRSKEGAEYVDFRKSFLADPAEAAGTVFEMDKVKYDWIIENVANFKAVARDRVFNTGQIKDDYSINLETFERDIELARQRAGDRENGQTRR